MRSIGVIGAGGWGTALAKLLTGNGHNVTIWCHEEETANDILHNQTNSRFLSGIKLPKELKATTQLKSVLQGSDCLVMAVPSQWVRETAKKVSPFISKDVLVINVAKGLEISTQKRLTEVLAEELPTTASRIIALSGPNHAEEVAREIPTATVVASPEQESAEETQDIFMNSFFRVYTNSDRIGVELGGALKNVSALAAGITEGLGFGDNTKAALITRGIAEMARLGVALGAVSHTFAGMSGVGDLFVTTSSSHSRNLWAGREIGRGRLPKEVLSSTPMVVEGVPTSKAVHLLSQKMNVEMPISTKVYEVLFEGASVIEGVKELMTRVRTHESEEVVKMWDE
jgi:glycerol-3-phosphate dehydrogenase (NAD(P)+)